jgi:uncharacterized protein YbjT (DUF2867 family)
MDLSITGATGFFGSQVLKNETDGIYASTR